MFFIGRIVLLFLAVSWTYCNASTAKEININLLKKTNKFTTWQGIEPDKWATLWLIKRYISPESYFLLVPPNAELPKNAISFGVPDTPIRRANKTSMFRRLQQALANKAQEIKYIDQIIDDIEVNIWDKPSHPHSLWFEGMYRQLLARYNRDQVPVDCYLLFFDNVAQLAIQAEISAKDYSAKLSLLKECPGLVNHSSELVEQIDHLNVLREISSGKKVVFIDTREQAEYDENHLPGSKLLLLRNVNKETIKEFLTADLVVPYCVKDFRGFEVAKAMKLLGIKRVATLSPNGLKGWIQAKLPLVIKGLIGSEQAEEKLLQCATEPMICLKEMI